MHGEVLSTKGEQQMSVALLRIFIFTFLPLLFSGARIVLDKSARNRERKLEIFLLYLFGLGVAANGIGGFVGHVFISDLVAQSIGWPSGNPCQLEVGFANLALGILGVMAMGRRDGFREATVVAVTVFGVGARQRSYGIWVSQSARKLPAILMDFRFEDAT